MKIIEKYLCYVYGRKKCDSINDVRVEIFLEKYSPTKGEERITYAKKLDASMMPPCQEVLTQKLKRTHL